MHVKLEDFKTGWYGINISIRECEIDIFIEQLRMLKANKDQHFHIASNFEGESGVGDIEFNIQEDNVDNMYITDFAIPPNR